MRKVKCIIQIKSNVLTEVKNPKIHVRKRYCREERRLSDEDDDIFQSQKRRPRGRALLPRMPLESLFHSGDSAGFEFSISTETSVSLSLGGS